MGGSVTKRIPEAEICHGSRNPQTRAPASRSACRSRGAPELRGGWGGRGECWCCVRSADLGDGDGFLGREGERVSGSGRAHGLRRAQGLHRLPHHQDAALARWPLRSQVAVQRVRDPVPEEEKGGAGAGRRRGRRAAAAAEDQEREGGGDRGAPRCGVRQGGGPQAAAADAAEETPRRGGEGGHPPHGPLLRRHLRLNPPPT